MLKRIFITLFLFINAMSCTIAATNYEGAATGADIDLLAGSATNLGKIVNGRVVTVNSQGNITNLNKLNATGTITTVGNIVGTTGIFSSVYSDNIIGSFIITNKYSANDIIETSTVTYAHLTPSVQQQISNIASSANIFFSDGTRAMSNNMNMGGYAITNAHSISVTNSIILSGTNTLLIFTNGAVDTVAASVSTSLQFIAAFTNTFATNGFYNGYRERLLKTPGDLQNLSGFLLGRSQKSENTTGIESSGNEYEYFINYANGSPSASPYFSQFGVFAESNAVTSIMQVFLHQANTNFITAFENPGITSLYSVVSGSGEIGIPAYASFIPKTERRFKLTPMTAVQSITGYPPLSVTYAYSQTNGQYGINNWGANITLSTNTIIPAVTVPYFSNIAYKIVSINTTNSGWLSTTNLNFDTNRVINLTNSLWTATAANTTGILHFATAYTNNSTIVTSNFLPRNLWLYSSNANYITVDAYFGNDAKLRLPSTNGFAKLEAQIWKTNQYHIQTIARGSIMFSSAGDNIRLSHTYDTPHTMSFVVPPESFWRVITIHTMTASSSPTSAITVHVRTSN